ncbi:MAG: hypothetical protein HYY30_10390 [Chloroflexi bacterium]|nr:hypothetical protein [Chloroflexota bacterium]
MAIVLRYGGGETGNRGQARETGVNELVGVGIDDLAKYRIVQFLCSRPDTCWNAVECAENLGLRPVERTVAELDELVGQHILEKQDADSLPRYRLTTDRRTRRDLSRLLSVAQAPLRGGLVLARLASGSVERVKREVRRNKRGRRALGVCSTVNCRTGDI